jgi:serine/threonine-protein phosphatase 5
MTTEEEQDSDSIPSATSTADSTAADVEDATPPTNVNGAAAADVVDHSNNDTDDSTDDVVAQEDDTIMQEEAPPDRSNEPNAEERATELKDLGNEQLQLGHFLQAITLYSQGLEFRPHQHVLLSNRALAYIKIENYGLALQDADHAIRTNAAYAKAYYRRASANYALNHYKLARKDFRQVVKLAPKDRDARAKLNECEKAIREEAFAKAIEAEQTAPLSATYDPSKLDINVATYHGPHPAPGGVGVLTDMDMEAALFQPGKLPREFVMAAVQCMKEQKLVHKRYVARTLLSCREYFASQSSLMTIDIPTNPPPSSDLPSAAAAAAAGDMENSETDQKGTPTLVVPPRLTVCGDTHGQYYDVLNIFENLNGFPHRDNPYLFNGDFVDRGSFSVEVILTFLLFKLCDPECIYLTRGNHETKNMNRIYGFEGEVKHKYDDKIFQLFLEVFEWLPLAAVVGNRVFVTHGGLPSVDLTVTLDDVRKVKRGMEPPEKGLMSDLLWSDPQPFPGKSPSKRGVGFSFGPDITANFCQRNNLDLVVRSHEVKEEGYLVEHNGKCITVFSAPNYCDTMGNKGAFIHFDKTLVPKYTQYTSVPHPNVKPMAYAAGMGGLFA